MSRVPWAGLPKESKQNIESSKRATLQGTNISHLGKRKIIFKSALKRFEKGIGWFPGGYYLQMIENDVRMCHTVCQYVKPIKNIDRYWQYNSIGIAKLECNQSINFTTGFHSHECCPSESSTSGLHTHQSEMIVTKYRKVGFWNGMMICSASYSKYSTYCVSYGCRMVK